MVTASKRKVDEEKYDEDDDVPIKALKPKKRRGRPKKENSVPSTEKKGTTSSASSSSIKKKRGRPKKEDSNVLKVYASSTKVTEVNKNPTTTATASNNSPCISKASSKPSTPKQQRSSGTTATTTTPTKKRSPLKKEKGQIVITITPDMIESTTKYSVAELMHKPSKWMEPHHEPLRRLFTMIQEDPQYYGFNRNNNNEGSNDLLSFDDETNNKNDDDDDDDDTVMVGTHTLIRMDGTRRGKCNFVMVDPEDGELVQCGNVTRFRCKECSERAGRNRYYCIDIEEDSLHSKSCFHLHRTLEYCKLAQLAGTIH